MTTTDTNAPANPMWGGHFTQAPASLMQEINASIAFDKQLFAQDIRGSLAHAAMLKAVGILTAEEELAIRTGLQQVEAEIREGKMAYRIALEDIHMHIESRLAEIIGAPAGKLHTARSRNDQVATAFRLYVRDACDGFEALLKELQAALVNRAEEHTATIMPGFTHLQVAQPVTFGHHLLAYVEMFGRDRRRFRDARDGMNLCPLGAAALAGTPHPIDREHTAQALGFQKPMANSLDAVSDRDFALETMAAASICAMHLSRLAEEMIIWSTPAFGFIKLSEAYTSGSSIMPQKRNPDAAELIRAKAGRINGALITLLTVMKALPLAYNKDMQEDKEPFFDMHTALVIGLRVMRGMVEDMAVFPAQMRRAAEAGYPTATDLADWLVRELDIPFRQAHHITGSIVRMAEEAGCGLSDVPLAQMQLAEPRIHEGIYAVLTLEHSVASRTSQGGTAPARVVEAVRMARRMYEL